MKISGSGVPWRAKEWNDLDQRNRPPNLASLNEKANRYWDDCNYQHSLDHSRHRHFRPQAAPIVALIHCAANRLGQRIDPETGCSCWITHDAAATLISEESAYPLDYTAWPWVQEAFWVKTAEAVYRNAKLAKSTFYQGDFHIRFLLQLSRHTGSYRLLAESHRAVANLDPFHFFFQPRSP